MRHYSKKEIYRWIAIVFLAVIVLSMLLFAAALYVAPLTEIETAFALCVGAALVTLLSFGLLGMLIAKRAAVAVKFYNSILDAISLPIVARDLNGSIIFINKSAEDLCELKRDALSSINVCALWNENVGKLGEQALMNGRNAAAVVFKGNNYNLETMRLYDDKSKESGYVELLRDNTRIENLFSVLDANVVISDAVTDEILFISDGYKRIRGISSTVNAKPGDKCHGIMYNLNQRCPDCNKDSLLKTPNVPVETEFTDPLTNRTYVAVDSVSNWARGMLVHTQRFIDITEQKATEESLKKRIEQQELMTSVTLAFFNSASVNDSIQNSFEQIGKFLDCSRIVLCKADSAKQVLRAENEWYSTHTAAVEYIQNVPFSPLDGLYIEFFNHKKKFVIAHNDLDNDMYPEIWKSGVKTFFCVPVYEQTGFWGLCAIEFLNEHKWDRSDISLGLFLGNVLSALLRRGKTEAELMQMSSIANNSPLFIAYTDLKGNFIFINTGATQITGYDYREIQEGGFNLLFGKDMAATVTEDYYQKIMQEGNFAFETPVCTKNGEPKEFSVHAFFIADLESGIGIIAADVTERRKLEKDIITAKEAAEQANMAKSEFLYRMSYEIRTPVTSIVGMTNIAKTTKNHAQIAYCLEQVGNASTYLMSVINDVLDMSKIEANELEIVYDDLDLASLVRNVTGMFSFLIDRSRLNIAVNISPDVPEIIISDKLRISQVLTNLLSNAARFAPESGNITISLSVTNATNDECELKIDITDSGVGLASRIDSPLFNTVPETGGGILQKYAGSGVMLSLAKQIAELMGGSLKYTPRDTDGNADGGTISFIFKAKVGKMLSGEVARENTSEIGDTTGRYAGKRVLLAEDVDINCDIFAALLSDTELQIDYAKDGIEAVQKFQDVKEAYDCIIMDIHMPGMNGYEASRIIREMNFTYAKCVPIIAFTVDSFKADIDKCLEAGMNSHIPKPMSYPEIIKVLDKYLLGD